MPNRKRRSPEKPSRSAPAGRPQGREGQPYWMYGRHPVELALANPERACRRLVVAEGTAPPPPRPDCPVETVPRGELQKLLPAEAVHQGLALLVEPLAERDLLAVCRPGDGPPPRVVVLDQITDPRNVGAILRSAAAFAAAAVVTVRHHAPPEGGVLAKAASGALELVPMLRVGNLARALDELADLGYWRFGLDAAGPGPLAAADLSGPVALVLGAEGEGLRRLTAERCDHLVHLPTAPAIGSLNVAAAAAVALYVADAARRPPAAADTRS